MALKYDDVVIMIPCYNPDEKFLDFIKNLRDSGYDKIIVIDDGSCEKQVFHEAKEICEIHLLNHSINLGQGRAYKTGFNYYLSELKPGGILKTR